MPTSTSTTVSVTINGTNFASNATATLNGYSLTITGQSSTQITATVSGNALSFTGAAKVYVYNPAPGNVSIGSQPANVNVINPSASFTVSPNAAPVGSLDTKVSIYGAGFFQDSVVQWNGTPLATTYGSSNSLTAVVPASFLATLGSGIISINTPENLGLAPPTQGFSVYLNLPVNDLVWNAYRWPYLCHDCKLRRRSVRQQSGRHRSCHRSCFEDRLCRHSPTVLQFRRMAPGHLSDSMEREQSARLI